MKTRFRAGGIAAAAAVTAALILSACGTAADAETTPGAPADASAQEPTEASGDVDPDTGEVTLTWWHTFTAEPMLSFWREVADDFEAQNPHVTVEIEAHSNFYDLLPMAFIAGDGPDVFQPTFMLQGLHDGGWLKDVSAWVPDAVRPAAEAFRLGDGIYGMGYTALPSGFWVNLKLWGQAGLTEADFPATLDELFDRWQTLQDAGLVPVAVGGEDGWPAAHWWYWAALRTVSPEAMQAAVVDNDFSDDGWLEASALTQTILDQGAFHPAWQTTPAQMGKDSASGQVIMGEAVMQLMGSWDFGVMAGIHTMAQGIELADWEATQRWAREHEDLIGWFPFPDVPGTAGTPGALMGGVDGFSVRADAPAEAAELVAFLVSTEVQQAYAAFGNIPVDPAATASMPAGPLTPAAEAVAEATAVHLWLDSMLGRGDFNDAVVAFMTGEGTAQGVVDRLVEVFG